MTSMPEWRWKICVVIFSAFLRTSGRTLDEFCLCWAKFGSDYLAIGWRRAIDSRESQTQFTVMGSNLFWHSSFISQRCFSFHFSTSSRSSRSISFRAFAELAISVLQRTAPTTPFGWGSEKEKKQAQRLETVLVFFCQLFISYILLSPRSAAASALAVDVMSYLIIT